MSKLYFLVPDTNLADRILSELKAKNAPEADIGVIASDHSRVEQVPETDLVDRSDFKPTIVQGTAIGVTSGLFAGLTTTAVPGGAVLAGRALPGSAFGSWVSGLIGISLPNRELSVLETAIKSGSVLMIVHTATVDQYKVKSIITDCYPEVIFEGETTANPLAM